MYSFFFNVAIPQLLCAATGCSTVSLTENNKYQFYSLWFDPTGLEFTALESITITITPPIRFRSIGEKYSSDEEQTKQTSQHNMRWIPLYAKKHK
jgi:hypothetical protein